MKALYDYRLLIFRVKVLKKGGRFILIPYVLKKFVPAAEEWVRQHY
jgi:hypothetical protein